MVRQLIELRKLLPESSNLLVATKLLVMSYQMSELVIQQVLLLLRVHVLLLLCFALAFPPALLVGPLRTRSLDGSVFFLLISNGLVVRCQICVAVDRHGD